MTSAQKRRLRDNLTSYAFLLPSMVIMLTFLVFPILYALYISFHQWFGILPPKYIGLENYRRLLQDGAFHASLKVTGLYALMVVPTLTFASLVVAVILNQKIRFQNLYKGLIYVPVIASATVVSLIWKWIYNADFGILNWLMSALGLPERIWLGDTRLALPSIALMAIWQSLGYYMVMYFAGLQSIPPQLPEAAEIDGASRLQIFWHITVPLLRPVMLMVIVMATIGSFQVFDAVYVMTFGGPANSTSSIVWLIYQKAFVAFQMGSASAMGIILFLVIFVISIIELHVLRQKFEY